VGERLGEVAQHPFLRRVVLLREEAEVVGGGGGSLEDLARFLAAALVGQAGGEPERAG